MGQQNVILNELNLKASQSEGYPFDLWVFQPATHGYEKQF